LSLTLGLKAAWTREVPAADPQTFNQRAHRLLRAQGFETYMLPQRFGMLVAARRGECRLFVADYPPQGIFAEPIAHAARPVGPVHFLWGGKFHSEAPKVQPLLDFYVQRELRRVGFPAERHPLVAVAASEPCQLDRIDWTTLEAMRS
jgi:hypothetical protein